MLSTNTPKSITRSSSTKITETGEELLDAIDTLPATQYLLIDVLQARLRLGENVWTFPTKLGSTIKALEAKGLVSFKHGSDANTLLVFPSPNLREALLSGTYTAPILEKYVTKEKAENGNLSNALPPAPHAKNLAENDDLKTPVRIPQDVNKKALRAIIEKSDTSVKRVAKDLKLKRKSLESWISGDAQPSEGEVALLSIYFNKKPSYFYTKNNKTSRKVKK
jgi:DNA-binding transcriptional regulator YiaG